MHSHGAESDACSLIKPLTLSSLEFQGEGLRHCVGLICTCGESFFHPTHGAGWRCDISVALEATCCSIHAWFDCKFDTDPRVLRCIGLTDSADQPISQDMIASSVASPAHETFINTMVISSGG